MAPLSSLPTEILSLIVETFHRKDLYACTLTNKQFYKAILPHLWCCPVLTNKDTVQLFLASLTAAPTRHPQGAGQWIRTLTLSNDAWTDAQLLLLMAHGLSQVEHLRLVSTRSLTDASLLYLPGHCLRLKSLCLFNVRGVTPAFLAAVGQLCLELTKVTFHQCAEFGDDTYAAFMECPIRSMAIISPPPSLLAEMPMWDLIVHFPGLTSLKLSPRFQGADRAFLPRLLSAAVHAWPALTTLALTGYHDHVEDGGGKALVDFLGYHPALTQLDLLHCSLSDTTIDALAAVCMPYLEALAIINIKPFSPDVLRCLIVGCPQLASVSCRGCGFTASEFPESGVKCRNYIHDHFYLTYLDQVSIHKIQFGDDDNDE